MNSPFNQDDEVIALLEMYGILQQPKRMIALLHRNGYEIVPKTVLAAVKVVLDEHPPSDFPT